MSVDLNNNPQTINTGLDSVVIVKVLEDVPGGKSLDVTGYTPTEIKAGHILTKVTATGVIKPLGVTAGAYVALPGTETYYGVALQSVPANRAMVGVMVRGRVNETASPYSVPAGAKTALSGINFVTD